MIIFQGVGSAPLLALALACGHPKAAPDDDEAQVRREIEAAIQEGIAATRDQDIDAYMSTFAPGYQVIDERGDTVTRDQLRANALRDWSIIVSTSALSMVIDSLTVTGDSATVFTAQRWGRLMLERDGITRDTVVTTEDHREIWNRTPAGWKVARVQELGGTVLLNGRPYKP